MPGLEFTKVITVRIKTKPVSWDSDERIYERLVEGLLLNGLEKAVKVALYVRRILYAVHLVNKIGEIEVRTGSNLDRSWHEKQ